MRAYRWRCEAAAGRVGRDLARIAAVGEMIADPPAPLRPSITIFTRSYPPAYLKGGPARSLFALVETLADDFAFSVITSALDDPAAGPMGSVEPNQWSAFGNAKTWYELKGRLPARRTAALLRETKPQLVYLNSLFDYRFAILPLLIIPGNIKENPCYTGSTW